MYLESVKSSKIVNKKSHFSRTGFSPKRVEDLKIVTAGGGFGRDHDNLFPTTTEARFLASASERWQLRGSKLA